MSSEKTNGIFELRISNDAKEEAVWTIDLKKNATVIKGTAKPKADVTLIMSDDTFTQLASGKVRTFANTRASYGDILTPLYSS